MVTFYLGERQVQGAEGTKFMCYTGWPKKSKPLPNDQKIVLNRVKNCE